MLCDGQATEWCVVSRKGSGFGMGNSATPGAEATALRRAQPDDDRGQVTEEGGLVLNSKARLHLPHHPLRCPRLRLLLHLSRRRHFLSQRRRGNCQKMTVPMERRRQQKSFRRKLKKFSSPLRNGFASALGPDERIYKPTASPPIAAFLDGNKQQRRPEWWEHVGWKQSF